MQDHTQTKEKILHLLKIRGPSLPVHIAKEIDQNILFTSAFLSELLSEKKIKISNMRVGSSPIYFIQGQEPQLEKYSENIKGKEKEALLLLKEKKFLNDETQQPPIRVALRSIKDFAIPFQKNNKLFWRYFKVPESEFIESKQVPATKPIPKKVIPLTDSQTATKQPITNESSLDIFDKTEEKQPAKKKTLKKSSKKKTTSKTNDKFFNKVKEFLKEKQIEITEIESIGKNELVFRVRKNQKEQLLFAYNKKQIKEDDLIKANKKASETNLRYTILCLGEPTKKLSNFIEAIKNLDEIEKMKN